MNRDHGVVNSDLEAYRQAELALIAARFSLPGRHRSDVDRAIDVACRLLREILRLRLRYSRLPEVRHAFARRRAVLRHLLREHGFPVTGSGASDAERFRAAVRAFGAGAIGREKYGARS